MTGHNFACKNIGMPCDFEIRGASSREEVMEQAASHAKHAHQIATVPEDLAAKIRSVITV